MIEWEPVEGGWGYMVALGLSLVYVSTCCIQDARVFCKIRKYYVNYVSARLEMKRLHFCLVFFRLGVCHREIECHHGAVVRLRSTFCGLSADNGKCNIRDDTIERHL